MLHRVVVAGVTLGIAACAFLEIPLQTKKGPLLYPPDVFAHRVATSHVVLYWNCTRPEADLLRVDGVAQNPWSSQEVRFLELELVGVDREDRVVSETKGAVPNILLGTNQISPFRLDLRTVGGEARFDLYCRYQYDDTEEMDALLAGPPIVGPRLLASTQNSLARDVCSETQHRAR